MILEPFCTPPGHEVVEATHQLVSKFGVVGRRLYSGKRQEDRPNVRAHMIAKDVRSMVGWWKWHRYTRFTAVRNPFDRAVSNFHWWADNRGLPPSEDFDAVRAAFRDYLLGNHMGGDRGITHIAGKFVIQDAIRYESLSADIQRIADKLGLALDPETLPKAKSGTSRPKRRHPADYFDAETTANVRKQLAWVFRHYNYSQDPADALAEPAR